MLKFVVDGAPAMFGPDTVLGLTAAQYATRRHNVTLLDAKGDLMTCRVIHVQQFKIGEPIQLDALPDKVTAEHLRTVDGVPAKAAHAVPTSPAKGRRGKKGASRTDIESSLEEAREAAAQALAELDAAVDGAGKVAAQEALDIANKVVADLEAALAAL